MSDRGKGRKAKGKSKTLFTHADLIFPVDYIHRLMSEGNYARNVTVRASVYLATVMEYLVAEALDVSGTIALDNKKSRIIASDLNLTIRGDEELNNLFSSLTIVSGGVLPNIQATLLPKTGQPAPDGTGKSAKKK